MWRARLASAARWSLPGAALMSGRYLIRLYRYIFAFDPETMTVGHIPAHEQVAGARSARPEAD